jgi:hypothetical protein
MSTLQTPVALFIFNRPEQTAKVFERIARAKPSTLLVIADGPRNEAERARCESARAVLHKMDWPCELKTNFSDHNLGCRKRMSGGIDWVFEQVESAILLEDDCVPDQSFFRFCEELLQRYADEPHVLSISGDNFQFGRSRTSDSYYFSRLTHVWGWATWRRAWRKYDVDMKRWPAVRDTQFLEDFLSADPASIAGIRDAIDKVYRREVDTWDTQWMLSSWLADGLTILPEVNLITNIGFGADATHTRSSRSEMANLPVGEMKFPLQHPSRIQRNTEADLFTLSHLARTKSA